ncbi:MAG: hypothetical protein SGJ11_14905 [Phycisphaerae bacterium]|nr:hypothetical protein [Phycisphaerae bacterium]
MTSQSTPEPALRVVGTRTMRVAQIVSVTVNVSAVVERDGTAIG